MYYKKKKTCITKWYALNLSVLNSFYFYFFYNSILDLEKEKYNNLKAYCHMTIVPHLF